MPELSSTIGNRTVLLPKVETAARAGVSHSYLYELISTNRFPRPVKVGRASRWVSTEVDRWITERIAERDGTMSA